MEKLVRSGPLTLWTEQSGNPAHPAVLLIMGQAAQAVHCPDALVDRLVERGFQTIRFDHRDTGLSSTVNFDQHPYVIADMSRDCLAILDAYDRPDAHVAGASLGGVIAQWLAVHAPARVRTLTLLTTTPMLAADPADIAPVTQRFRDHVARPHEPGPEADVALFRVMNGESLPFDEQAARAMSERAWSRAADPAAAANHSRAAYADDPTLSAPLSTITAPTTIVHGDQDPIFPLPHAEALTKAIPHARLELIPGMGHTFFTPGLPERIADLIAR
ncbi:alpha/beta hydrolase [Actinoplanes sp. NPDC026619]|uniref:alpha/beta fold hydrolase n=1 Tax=Actinoplanes sp. NPDC026619 TaxID=3155798 RepID=UPI0033D591BC